MSSLREDTLLSLLSEMLSELRQINSHLQALRTQQQQTPLPVAVSDADYTPEPCESGRSHSPEEVLRYLRETRGEDDS